MKQARDMNLRNWKAKEESVLIFVRNRDKGNILLIHKKTGLGAGLINAPGGRIEAGETPERAACREIEEEVGISVKNPELGGELYFEFANGHSIRGYVYQTCSWAGKPSESIEAKPFWCPELKIPYHKMWMDDSFWLPHLLADRPFRGRFIFKGEKMLSMSLDVEQAPGSDSGIPGINAI